MENKIEIENWIIYKSVNFTKVIADVKNIRDDKTYPQLEFWFDDFNTEKYSNTVSSVLNHSRLTEEEKYNLLCNLDKVQNLLTEDVRKTKVLFTKSGGTAKGKAVTNRLTIPTKWIKNMNITEEDREVEMKFDNSKITIEKIN